MVRRVGRSCTRLPHEHGGTLPADTPLLSGGRRLVMILLWSHLLVLLIMSAYHHHAVLMLVRLRYRRVRYIIASIDLR